MKQPRIDLCTVYLRRLDGSDGANEEPEQATTLETLFSLILDETGQRQADRVVISGWDAAGERREITLLFQSIKETDG